METLFQDIIRAFGWSILNSIWQSGIIYAALLVVLLLTPKLKSTYRHNLSFVALMTMFGWFVYTFSTQLHKSSSALKSGVDLNMYELNSYIQSLPETFTQKAESYFPIIFTMYVLGLLIQVFLVMKGFSYLSRLKKTAISEVPASWLLLFEQTRQSLNLNKNIQFKLSDLVDVPVVAGYFKPIILFPIALVASLDEEQVEAILIHELTHIKRNDYLLNIVKTCVETSLFFNPFIWLTSRFIQIEREHACDDLVVDISGKPLSYAKTLLKLEIIQQEKLPSYALASTGKTQHLYQRIKRITNMKANYLNVKQQFAALTLAVAGLISIAWTNPEVKERATEVTDNIKRIDIFEWKPALTPSVKLPDTIKKKQKIQITITNAEGKVSIYNDFKSLPDSIHIDQLTSVKDFRTGANVRLRGMPFGGNADSTKIRTLIINGKRMNGISPDSIQQISVLKALPGIKISTKDGKTELIVLRKGANAALPLEGVKSSEGLNTLQFKRTEALAHKLPNFKAGGGPLVLNGDTVQLNYTNTLKLNATKVEMIAGEVVLKNKEMAEVFASKMGQLKEDAAFKNSKEYQDLKKDFDKKIEALKKKQQKKNNKK